MSKKSDMFHTPAPRTAREVLEDASMGDHAICSVVAWGKSNTGSLWLKCSCRPPCISSVPDTKENRLSLQNVPKEYA